MNVTITFHEDPPEDDLRLIAEKYQACTEAQIGAEERREIAFFLRDENGSVIGGVCGGYGNYGWLWIGLLWVAEELRGQGYGAQLLGQIEEEAKRNGCTHAYLNSFSFQGVEFYQKLGYTIFGEMKDFPPGHSVCSLSKELK